MDPYEAHADAEFEAWKQSLERGDAEMAQELFSSLRGSSLSAAEARLSELGMTRESFMSQKSVETVKEEASLEKSSEVVIIKEAPVSKTKVRFKSMVLESDERNRMAEVSRAMLPRDLPKAQRRVVDPRRQTFLDVQASLESMVMDICPRNPENGMQHIGEVVRPRKSTMEAAPEVVLAPTKSKLRLFLTKSASKKQIDIKPVVKKTKKPGLFGCFKASAEVEPSIEKPTEEPAKEAVEDAIRAPSPKPNKGRKEMTMEPYSSGGYDVWSSEKSVKKKLVKITKTRPLSVKPVSDFGVPGVWHNTEALCNMTPQDNSSRHVMKAYRTGMVVKDLVLLGLEEYEVEEELEEEDDQQDYTLEINTNVVKDSQGWRSREMVMSPDGPTIDVDGNGEDSMVESVPQVKENMRLGASWVVKNKEIYSRAQTLVLSEEEIQELRSDEESEALSSDSESENDFGSAHKSHTMPIVQWNTDGTMDTSGISSKYLEWLWHKSRGEPTTKSSDVTSTLPVVTTTSRFLGLNTGGSFEQTDIPPRVNIY